MLDAFDMTSIQGAVSGGAPLPSEVVEQVYRRLGILIKLVSLAFLVVPTSLLTAKFRDMVCQRQALSATK
jgi:hypothetical protein